MQRVGWFRSTLGSRVVVSLTGLGLVGFVVFHMLGNLQVFEGPAALNSYAAMLRDMPMFLWAARIGLLGVAIFHIALAIQLALRNRRARPAGYALREYRHASVASRTMALTGSVLLVFVVFHLLHLTAGLTDPSGNNRLDAGGHADVYGKVVHAFQNPLYVVIYLVGQLALGVHLSHAVSGSLQTLGIEHAAFNRLFKAAGPAVAVLVVFGNLAIIFAIFFGIVRA